MLFGVSGRFSQLIFVQMRYSMIRLLYVVTLISVLLAVFQRPIGMAFGSVPSIEWHWASFLEPFQAVTWLAGYESCPWEATVGKPDRHHYGFSAILGVLCCGILGFTLFMTTYIGSILIWVVTSVPPPKEKHEPKPQPALDWQI